MDRVKKQMTRTINAAGGLHEPAVQAWLANRQLILQAKNGQQLVERICKGAKLWQAIANRAKRKRAAQKAAATRRNKT
jgi:hypothetical protein